MERHSCLCRDVLPPDRRKRKGLHGNSSIAAKSTLRVLSVVPLEEIEELNDAAAVLCNNCERKVHNISHYQSKVDSLKKIVTEMLSSLTPAGKRLFKYMKGHHKQSNLVCIVILFLLKMWPVAVYLLVAQFLQK